MTAKFSYALLAVFLLALRQPDLHLTETVLTDLPGTIYGALQTSPGNGHVFSTIRALPGVSASGAWALFRDGKLVGRYDGELPHVSNVLGMPGPGVPLTFSRDGEHYAFIGGRDGKQFVVVDGVEGPSYERVAELRLSSTGNVAYVVGRDGERHLVRNGRIGPAFYDVRTVGFSPDGQHLAIITSTGTVSRIYLDDTPQIEELQERDPVHGYRTINNAAFSSDSHHLAFVAETNQGARVVLDGKTVGLYPEVAALGFSPDGRHLCFVVSRRSTTLSVVVDGVEQPVQGSLGEAGVGLNYGRAIIWSPDSMHTAYFVRRDSLSHLVIDGIESAGYRTIFRAPVFLQNGSVAYSAFDGM